MTDKIGNNVYVDIYGRCEEQIKLVINDKVIYEIDTNTEHRLISARRGPLIFDRNEIRINLRVDKKDTVFIQSLERNNYWLIGYSEIREEFQFTTYDSVQFFAPTLDNDVIRHK